MLNKQLFTYCAGTVEKGEEAAEGRSNQENRWNERKPKAERSSQTSSSSLFCLKLQNSRDRERKNYQAGGGLYPFPGAAGTYHRLGGTEQRNLLCHGPRSQEPERKVCTVLFL